MIIRHVSTALRLCRRANAKPSLVWPIITMLPLIRWSIFSLGIFSVYCTCFTPSTFPARWPARHQRWHLLALVQLRGNKNSRNACQIEKDIEFHSVSTWSIQQTISILKEKATSVIAWGPLIWTVVHWRALGILHLPANNAHSVIDPEKNGINNTCLSSSTALQSYATCFWWCRRFTSSYGRSCRHCDFHSHNLNEAAWDTGPDCICRRAWDRTTLVCTQDLSFTAACCWIRAPSANDAGQEEAKVRLCHRPLANRMIAIFTAPR